MRLNVRLSAFEPTQFVKILITYQIFFKVLLEFFNDFGKFFVFNKLLLIWGMTIKNKINRVLDELKYFFIND